ncbi:type IV pilus twitching motility protein PilT [Tepidibacillus marianensis]|uniref:type IV pilus twitching motility protein PilT n=1 Tax=Tepidibacillus marianensis TaxID=3131995 RepID=UPI0030D3B66F
MYTIEQLMREAFEKRASDLHLTVGARPTFRIHGKLVPVDVPPLTPENTVNYLKKIITESQYQEFLQKGEIDFSYGLAGISRFRINAYQQRGTISLAIRVIPTAIPSLGDLGVPGIVNSFVDKPQGLVLVTGPTGSGKSTTLAAMIDVINKTQYKHIITLEDPIEYLHRHGQSLIDQREIGVDSFSFAAALRAALRQDPDVILVGEMRDLETISIAVTAAETGHLVFATLHTSGAANTIDRIIDVFPAHQQPQIRLQLASVLLGVMSQRLLPTIDETGRVVGMEILINTPAVANLIRSEKVHQIQTVMQTGKSYGMQTMEMALQQLVKQGKIDEYTARQFLI